MRARHSHTRPQISHLCSVVLLCNLTNHNGESGEPCVVKLDDANSMLEEFEGTKKMAGVLGDSACAPKAIVYDAESIAEGEVLIF